MFSYIKVFFLTFILFSPTYADSLLFDGNFETGDDSQFEFIETCCNYSSRVVATQARSGHFSNKFILNKTDADVANSKRVEFIQDTNNEAGKLGDERWIGFSIFIPSNWQNDNADASEGVWQVYPIADTCETQGSLTPPAALLIDQGKWEYGIRSDADQCSVRGNQPAQFYDLGDLKKGAWNDFVFHIKWSIGSDGYTQIWRDGVKVLDYSGPNYYNDENSGFMKFGLYKWGWKSNPSGSKVQTRVLYLDEVKIGGADSSFSNVSAHAPELVANGSFEQKMTGWEDWGGTKVLRHTIAPQGKYLMKIHPSAGGFAQEIPAGSLKKLKLSVIARISDSSKSGVFGVQFLSSSGAQLYPQQTISIYQSRARFATYGKIIDVPDNVDTLRLYFWKDSTIGPIYLDKVSLTEY